MINSNQRDKAHYYLAEHDFIHSIHNALCCNEVRAMTGFHRKGLYLPARLFQTLDHVLLFRSRNRHVRRGVNICRRDFAPGSMLERLERGFPMPAAQSFDVFFSLCIVDAETAGEHSPPSK